MIVIAVDVGIQVCGYAVCAIKSANAHIVKEGQIKPSRSATLPQKLDCIIEKLELEVKEYKPSAIIVEKLYSHHRHPTTMGVLAQVKGVVALFTYRWGLDYFEFSSTRARKSFLGRGNVNSTQVKKMAENITGQQFESVHTADAYSLAVAFAHEQKLGRLLGKK
ncbi:MAG: crossover junction endodeoxyribonuclease RuvC [Candidatus Omnitrophica bacterium]|nr:crossover junction endodeoxyribonuclease RuvC [Candidatus Omnitrophota bacterium]